MKPDVLLTAAHVLQDAQDKVHRATRVEVSVGHHGHRSSKKLVVDTYYGTRVVVPRPWRKKNFSDRRYDMGLIKLDRAIKNLTPAQYNKEPLLHAIHVRILGYPGENLKQVCNCCQRPSYGGCMLQVEGVATFNGRLGLYEYKLSTEGAAVNLRPTKADCVAGNSGGPVCLVDNPRVIAATHSAGSDDTKTNYATPVNVNFIEAGLSLLERSINGLPFKPWFVSMQRTADGWSKDEKKTKTTKIPSPISSVDSGRKVSVITVSRISKAK